MGLAVEGGGCFVTIGDDSGRQLIALILRQELCEERRERCAGASNLHRFRFERDMVATRRSQDLDHRPCSLGLDVGDACDRRYSARSEERRARRNGTRR